MERREYSHQKGKLTIHDQEIYYQRSPSNIEPKCSYLGPKGTYSEEATEGLLGNQIFLEPSDTITQVIRGVETGKFDVGVIPFENSSEGNVIEAVRGIVKSDLNILGEKVIPIHNTLFGTEAAWEKRIVRSHVQAFGQCVEWLENNLPGYIKQEDKSTSEAVRIAAENDELAIGSINAGKIYDIPVMHEKIEDRKGNTTRFLLLGRGETSPTGNDRTTILFSLKNRIGLLRDALGAFADRGINLSKIDSFPIGAIDEYYFLFSIGGHKEDHIVKEALSEFYEKCLKARIIGSYAKAPIPDKYFEPDAILGGWLEPEES